jgi:hypothetical protein
MELSVHDNRGVTVVMASGEMDAGNSAQLGEELDRLLTKDPGRWLLTWARWVL